ncbi:MAG: polymorphic toxin type 8 domain-containing protein [Candidatus Sumerlaeia bacterium]|nr:polymorphic toxin type 8 domain-containing protein [Candidatus Sumerlaeia bacterium]
MQILLVDGSTVNVIANNKTRTQSRVYNFSVHQYENYFAGDLGVLVHNCKVIGRSGKQQQLRKLASDPKLSKSLRGEIQRDINEINRGKRPTIRVPQGYNLAHKRGFEARKGYDYSYSHLNTVELHNL